MTERSGRGRAAMASVLLGLLAGCFALNSNNVRVQRATSMQQELDDLDRALAVKAITAEEYATLKHELTTRVRASSPAVFEKPGQ